MDEFQPNILPLPNFGIRIESHEHGPGFRTSPHSHPYPSLIYVIDGEGECMEEDRSYRLSPDSTLILEDGKIHQLIDLPGKSMVLFVVYFSSEMAESNALFLEPLLKQSLVMKLPEYAAHQARRLLRQMLHEQETHPLQYERSLQLHLALFLLLMHRYGVPEDSRSGVPEISSSEDRVRKVLASVAERFYEPHGLATVSRLANLSQRHFTSLCRKICGTSFNDYLSSLRVKKAERLLLDTKMSILVVAFTVGFEELSTFYRTFKRISGTTPKKFRRTRRNPPAE
ncbi:MAG: AraC family transcriptional regulator [Pirellulales bacterium]|nr:AraC family transcriptional regulator [Pirellulales bacterium]